MISNLNTHQAFAAAVYNAANITEENCIRANVRYPWIDGVFRFELLEMNGLEEDYNVFYRMVSKTPETQGLWVVQFELLRCS